MTLRIRLSAALLTAAVLAQSHPAAAQPSVDLVKTDLRALIREGASHPNQFAVDVPHAVSPTTAGSWSSAGPMAEWSYAVRIPTAVSISFHAAPVRLPADAVLTVRSATTTFTYHATDVHRGGLWSRIHRGDTLEFSLEVPSAERSKVTFQIVSLQAGYRGIGPGVRDNTYYREIKQSPQQAGNETCVQNYECSVTASNSPLGQATVALVIGNEIYCTGTLINDVPGDNTPYVLTARHCEADVLGGGAPGAAADVTVYWDATTPCGQTLGSILDPGIKTQAGATTIVEQQDAWLILLDTTPVVSDAEFAGFDASGGTIQGGYTIQHALAYDKQFTAWFGQALGLTNVNIDSAPYQSNFWQVVNQTGNIAPGASGSGLIDQNNHLVGSLTFGLTPSDSSGYGSCPANPPSAPNGANGVADFTSLAGVWNSTADTTSSTGSTTLQSVLDPANTGQLVVSSIPAVSISFTASSNTPEAGQTIQLMWSVPAATGCTASGGLAGDGWSGTLAASGSRSVSEPAALDVTYQLTCRLATGGSVSSSLLIPWYGSTPFVQLYPSEPIVWTTRPLTLNWTSNVPPCSVSGGSLSISNQPSSGSTTTTQSTAGDVTYKVSCGSGPTAVSQSQTVTYVPPSLTFGANATDRLLGQPLTLGWIVWADSCASSGGAPNDGWGSNIFGPVTTSFSPRVSTLGTYTYTLTCSSGPLSVSQSVTVTIEDNAPYVTASLSPSSTTYTASPADYVTVNWTTNLSLCDFNWSPAPLGDPLPSPPGTLASIDGPAVIAPNAPGTYTLTVTCSGVGAPSATSAPMTVTVLPPPPPTATVTISPTSITIPQQFTITWSSNYASGCTPTGGAPGAVWIPGDALAASGSQILSPNEPGQFTFGVSCASIASSLPAATAQATVTVAELSTPNVTLTASSTQVTDGQSFTLNWSSSGATGCTASGGGANGSSWSGSLQPSGSITQNATTVGNFTYTLSCSNAQYSTEAQASVDVSAAAASSGAGGHGGGGAMDLLELACLGTLLARRSVRRR